VTDDVRTRILRAAVVCVGRYGLSKTSLEDVAREADVGRATVYRYFEGGRDELLAETISFEVATFFRRLAVEVDDAPDFPTRLEKGLLFAHRAVLEHEVLQKVLDTEPERLLPHLSTSGPLILLALTAYLEPLLADVDLRHGLTPATAADWLARMVLSFIIGQGGWDLVDPDEVHRLVHDHLLAGVLAPSPTGG
jgi:AcrR family transcriptional regulator